MARIIKPQAQITIGRRRKRQSGKCFAIAEQSMFPTKHVQGSEDLATGSEDGRPMSFRIHLLQNTITTNLEYASASLARQAVMKT